LTFLLQTSATFVHVVDCSEIHKKVSHVATTSELFKVQNTVNQYQVQMKRLENWFEYKYLGI